ncbi:MAG: HPr family phosphocarrier protein [Mariprofundus sp.]|nr:HPr family phosphocarrier protein [Mariprofundus sp.]
MRMPKQSIRICNKLGLHARASSKLATEATRFKSEIQLIKGEITINCKSIMGIMMLAACNGTDLILRAEGEDAQAALEAIKTLVDSRFGEAQ